MSDKRTVIHEEIASMVSAVRRDLKLDVLGFHYGIPEELLGTLDRLSRNEDSAKTKYPLVYLQMPLTENHGGDGFYYEVPIRLLIATQSKGDWSTEERFSNSFKPVLQPIYEELLNQIVYSTAFSNEDETMFDHDKVDDVYWGKKQLATDEYKSLEFIDAIVITDLILKVKYKNC